MQARRTFLKAAVGCGATLLLAACGGADKPSEPEPVAEPDVTETPETEAAPTTEQDTANPTGSSDALVLFFSRAGENYNVGVVEKGNTAVMAKMIAGGTGADLFELVPAVAYPEGYDDCCDVALDEKNAGARPELEALPDLSPYSTVYLGFPCW